MIQNTLRGVIENTAKLVALADLLTPEFVQVMEEVGDKDVLKKYQEVISASKKESEIVNRNSDTLSAVVDGLYNIGKVLEIEDQVSNISIMRDIISKVVAMKEEIVKANELASSIIQCNGLEPTIKEIVKMKSDLEFVLGMKNEIHETNFVAERMRDDMFKMEAQAKDIKSALAEIRTVRDEISASEEVTKVRLIEMQVIQKQLREFQVKTFSIDPDRKGYSKYESETNTLNLFIPKGEIGKEGIGKAGRRGQRGLPGTAVEKGDDGKIGRSGRDGNNFNIDIFGMIREKSMYGNRPIGTSFLSLDESPCMIYFRKSNALDHWTEGQPFGISDGDFSLPEIAGAVIHLLNEKGAKDGN